MNVVKTLNLRVMACRVAVAANQLHSAQTRGLGGIKFLMDIRQEQDGAGAWPSVQQCYGRTAPHVWRLPGYLK